VLIAKGTEDKFMSHQNLRIISLIPSATEILAALGLTDDIVGRSHECDYPQKFKTAQFALKHD
jgi:ABC-type hemin transport system substrate-binding protein